MKVKILQFVAEEIPFSVQDEKTTGKAFCARAEGNDMEVSVLYHFRSEPLTLHGKISRRDAVSIRFMPWRIELYVNDRLVDEEWPCGDMCFSGCVDGYVAPFSVNWQEKDEETKEMPSVLYTFQQAEGWQPEENVFVGDCMPYVHHNRYHVLYLKDRHHHMSKWGFGAHQWEHISSTDFITWDVHPTAVPITRPWEGSICTGSWICRGDREYLFYTIRMTDGSAAPICRSVSCDGFHFEKDEAFGFTLPDRYHGPSARDPKVIKGNDGLYHMILTTSLVAENKGCLAHLTSFDLDNWQDAGAIYVSEDDTQPECPDYFELNGIYYLLFSLRSRAQYRYSTHPFDGWCMPENPEIPCASVPKGAVWQDRVVFTGYESGNRRRYAGHMTFASAGQRENGELIFGIEA